MIGRLRPLPSIAFAALYFAGANVSAVPEWEDNNTFADRNVLAPGVTRFEGSLETAIGGIVPSLTPDFSFLGETFDQEAVFFGPAFWPGDQGLSGLTPGQRFTAITDNPDDADLFLGVFDENGALLDTDDDSSPLGDGYASALGGIVNPDGSINLAVSGYPDFTFTGDHSECCEFDLFVSLDDALPGVDHVSFTGLTPGQVFFAETSPGAIGSLDTMLAQFDAGGTLVNADDDGGTGLFSMVGGIVPGDGIVNLAVTGYPDTDFVGLHEETGDYLLDLTTFFLGGPGATPDLLDIIADLVLLPTFDPVNDRFLFGDIDVVPGQRINLDPDVAVGYTYDIPAGPAGGLFDTVLLPAVGGDNEFELWLFDTGLNAFAFDRLVMAGAVVPLGGVDTFRILGIGAALDPTDPLAFLTTVTFTEAGVYDITMAPIIETSAVPEPATFALLGLGLAGIGLRRGRKRR